MTKTTFNSRILSLIIVLTMLVGMVPYSSMVAFAVEGEAPFLVTATATLGEEMTLDFPYRENGEIYVGFTPQVTDTYIIKAVSGNSDPILTLYDWYGTYIDKNDDYVDRLFRMEVVLEAGNTYYLGLSDYNTLAECTFVINKACDLHTPTDDVNCLGMLCDVCGIRFGEPNDEHNLSDSQNCLGYYCFDCGGYYGEKSEHADRTADFLCDECGGLTGVATGTVGSENHFSVEFASVEYPIYAFTPSESGKYGIYSEHDGDPFVYIFNDKKEKIAEDDDSGTNLNFYVVIEVEAGRTYYLYLKNYSQGTDKCDVFIEKHCDVHVPAGPQSCYGYLCSVCGMTYGEALPHDTDVYGYDYNSHYYDCSMCGNNKVDEERHEYNEYGVCSCGREKTYGVFMGTIHLTDGQYVDNNGNVSSVKPDGGYAHYLEGVLTLNDFSVTVGEENIFGTRDAIYSEVDLEIIVKGNNFIKAIGDDGIYVVDSNLTISGDGVINISNEKLDDSVGDGIDLDGGTLTIYSGTFIIDSEDHGIEVFGNAEINDGIFYIDADDDGIDTDYIVINGGIFYIEAEDNGIDAEFDIIINGGAFTVYTEDERGMESSENIIINDGNFYIYSCEECIAAMLSVVINGGQLELISAGEYAVINSSEDIAFGEEMGEHNVQYDDSHEGYVLVDTNESVIYSIFLCEFDKDVLISRYWMDEENDVIKNDGNGNHNIKLYDEYADKALTLGIDYVVEIITQLNGEPGVYYAVVKGIGDYSGSFVTEYVVHRCYDITLDNSVSIELSGIYDDVYSYVRFVPPVTTTYRFSLTAENSVMIYIMDEDRNYVYDLNAGQGNVSFDVEFTGGTTYYIDVYDEESGTLCNIDVELICNGHVGGEATYTEYAVCEICGGEYGELLECPGHFGGEATYQESPICEECGYHYGEKLYCDHMCHKGGIYVIIWGIFEDIYDYLGIETECKCGEHH